LKNEKRNKNRKGPGTPLKVINMNGRYIPFVIQKKGTLLYIYFPFGTTEIPVEKTKETEKKEQKFDGRIKAPLSGKIIKINVKRDEKVEKDTPLCVIEAMKMQNEITSPVKGIIKEISINEGKIISKGDILFRIEIENNEE